MKKDSIYIDHILECIEAIREYTSVGEKEFYSNRMMQKAVLRELQELAESTKRLSDAIKDTHPGIPWSAIVGFRNVLVHDYLGVNLKKVWQVIEVDIPALYQALKEVNL